MRPDEKPWHKFLILTAHDSELGERALHSVLEDRGFDVRSVDTGSKVLQLARSLAPDAVILTSQLSDISGVEVCRQLTADAAFSENTPIFILSTHGSSRADRLQAYSAGAWEVCSMPLDGSALLLKLQTFLRARQVAERLRDESLLDAATGLYNLWGLRRRAIELGADASRRHEALAFIVFTPLLDGRRPEELDAPLLEQVAESCRRHVRRSDVLGRVSTTDFALIAPCTDAHCAAQLIDRLEAVVARESAADVQARPTIGLRAAYSAHANFADSSIEPVEMLRRATLSLDSARADAPQRIELDNP